jgi:hypothetical protein
MVWNWSFRELAYRPLPNKGFASIGKRAAKKRE